MNKVSITKKQLKKRKNKTFSIVSSAINTRISPRRKHKIDRKKKKLKKEKYQPAFATYIPVNWAIAW